MMETTPVFSKLTNQTSLSRLFSLLFVCWAGLSVAVSSEGGPRIDKSSLPAGFGVSKELLMNVSSEWVDVVIAGNGNFVMGTRIGNPDNPNDDNSEMLFGYPTGPFETASFTGGTTLRVDGNDHLNSGGGLQIGTVVDPPAVRNGEYQIGWLADGIHLVETLTLVRGVSGVTDTLKVHYVVENQDFVPHEVGVRLLLDTQLANNDGAPFKIPGVGSVTQEFMLEGAAVPDFWQSFDNLANPTMQTQGTLKGLSLIAPDRVIWADWGNLRATTFDYTVDPQDDLTDDSSVGIYWGPQSLQPGGSRMLVTYYGLSDIEILRSELVIGLSGPAELFVEGSEYVPNPFLVTLFVGNTGSGNAGIVHNVTATLQLPPGLVPESGESLTHLLGDLSPDQETQTSWRVLATGNPTGPLFYMVSVDGDEISPLTVEREVFVPPIAETPTPTPTTVGVPTATPTATRIPSGGVAIHPGFEQGVLIGSGLTQSSVALGDIDEDGLQEILLGGADGGLYAFNGDGSPVVDLVSGKASENNNNSQAKDIAGATPGLLFRTTPDTDGFHPPILSTPTLVDVDSDQRVDILWGTDEGRVYRLELRLSTDPLKVLQRPAKVFVPLPFSKEGPPRNRNKDLEEDDDIGYR